MVEHKHAEVLRAIADGVPRSEFEIFNTSWPSSYSWEPLTDFGAWFSYPNDWEIRRKPQYIIVNGFKVPKPLDVMPNGTIYTPAFMGEGDGGWLNIWNESRNKSIALQKGIAHSTQEAAIAHAKAMLGIDPKWSE